MRRIPLAAAWAIGTFVAITSACGQTTKEEKRKEVVVGCNSTVANDFGGCRRPAQKKCRSDVEFVAVLASTPLGVSGLHTISARYRCLR